jgi:hypothetical protein
MHEMLLAMRCVMLSCMIHGMMGHCRRVCGGVMGMNGSHLMMPHNYWSGGFNQRRQRQALSFRIRYDTLGMC